MQKDKINRRAGAPSATCTAVLALFLVICLAECATGSCLSYGHSCWGAHGKRSGKPPATAPDWFLTKLIRRMDANGDLHHARQPVSKNDDINAIYQVDMPDDSTANDRVGADNDNGSLEVILNRNPAGKPMLDEDLISKLKLWQIMVSLRPQKPTVFCGEKQPKTNE